MINSIEDLRSGGELPQGPVSAWPKERNVAGGGIKQRKKKIKATTKQMAAGLAKTALQGIRNGKVSTSVREARYDTCKACPSFDAESKRCGECGCFMGAKTWIGGNPDSLCPLSKWEA